VIINLQCTSCHTRYRIDEELLPEATPTFKCSRCNHVFSYDPRVGGGSADTPTRNTAAARRAQTLRAKPRNVVPPADANTARRSPPHAPPKPSNTDDLINRDFRDEPTESARGENLAFDFDDAPASSASPSDSPREPALTDIRSEAQANKPQAQWEVGDDASHPPPTQGFKIGIDRSDEAEPEPDGAAAEHAGKFVDDVDPPIYNRTITRSSRFFHALFLLVAAGFGGATLTIHGAPAAALEAATRLPILGDHFIQPITPARMVALGDVHASYQSSKDGRPALVIQGEGENVGLTSLHLVQITARIATPHGAVERTTYCGNSLMAGIGQMTGREIELYQQQPPLKDFALESSASSRFAIVFLDPPTSVRSVELTVTRAEPSDGAGASPPLS
jgi:predicted Zn finger-like uncharacterized protein